MVIEICTLLPGAGDVGLIRKELSSMMGIFCILIGVVITQTLELI